MFEHIQKHQNTQDARLLSCYGNISKSEDADKLEKSGEGTKGGKVIGHTKSGKAIYESHSNPAHKDFTSQDHLDAHKKHVELYKQEVGKKNAEGATADEKSAARTAYHNHEQQETAHMKSYRDAMASDSDKVIGKTKSGKEVRDVDSTDKVSGRAGYHADFAKTHKDFSSEDHAEAAKMHGDKAEHHNKEYDKHLNSVTADEWNDDKNEKGQAAYKGTKEASSQNKKHLQLAEWHKEAAKAKK